MYHVSFKERCIYTFEELLYLDLIRFAVLGFEFDTGLRRKCSRGLMENENERGNWEEAEAN